MREPTIGKETRSVSKRIETEAGRQPWKLLLWTAVAGLIFGADRRRRVRRGSAAGRSATASTCTRRAATSSSSRSTTIASPRSATGRGRGAITAPLIDRLTAAWRQAHLLRHQLRLRIRSGRRRGLRRALDRAGSVTLAARYKVGPVQGTEARSAAAARVRQARQAGDPQRPATITRMRCGDCPMRCTRSARSRRPVLRGGAGRTRRARRTAISGRLFGRSSIDSDAVGRGRFCAGASMPGR